MNLAVIPARGGSKRIPLKNIRQFAGKPLVAYSIEAAKESNLFEKIVVSTDCEKIANVAIKYGAEVPFLRPKDLSDDFTGTKPVTNHAIQYCKENYFVPEFTCCIYATAPFLQVDYLVEALKVLKQSQQHAFSFSVTTFPFPIQRAICVKSGGVEPMFPEKIGMRSQDLTEAYHDAGQFYWGRTEDYLLNKPMFAKHSIPIVLPRYLVQDIDTEEDWLRAELMYKSYIGNNMPVKELIDES